MTTETDLTPDPEESPDFPTETPVNEMELEDQVKYWRHYARKHESRAKQYKDLDVEELQLKANAYDELDLDALEARLNALDTSSDEEDENDPGYDEGDDDEDAEIDADNSNDPDEVRRQARLEVLMEQAPQRVGDAIRARSQGLPEKFIESFIEDVDVVSYLDDDLEVDTEAIQERMDSFRELFTSHNTTNHAGYRVTFKSSGVQAGMDDYRNNR